MNAASVVPQYRERVFFVGSRLDLGYRGKVDWERVENRSSMGRLVLGDVLEEENKEEDDDGSLSAVKEECELTERQWGKVQSIHRGEALVKARLDLSACAPTLISSYRMPASASTRYIMEEKDGTLREGDRDGDRDDPSLSRRRRPRFLTPRECARIMGFPEDFDVGAPLNGEMGHIYKGLGNAVVPGVVEKIGKEILRLMREVGIEGGSVSVKVSDLEKY